MSQPNIFVSNGTCYTSGGKEADSSFIPCGNDAFGHVQCCAAGDTCLEKNACFGAHGPQGGKGTLLTYLSGCSDKDYKDSSCPSKGEFPNQPWVGLVYCDGAWLGCSQSGSPATLQEGSPCSCPAQGAPKTAAFSGGSTIAAAATLPKSKGASIQWNAGHIPTQPPPPSQTSNSPSNTNSNSNTSPITSNSSTSSQSTPTGGATGGGVVAPSGGGIPSGIPAGAPGDTTDGGGDGGGNGLSTGAKAGIGVGAAVGGLILLAVVVALFWYRRKAHRSAAELESATITTQPSKFDPAESHRVSAMSTTPGMASTPGMSTTPGFSSSPGTPGTMVSEMDGRSARPWSLRSELEGNTVGTSLVPVGHSEGAMGQQGPSPGHLSPVAELPGNDSYQQGQTGYGPTPGGGYGPVQGGGQPMGYEHPHQPVNQPQHPHQAMSQMEGNPQMTGQPPAGGQGWGAGWRG